MFRRNDISTLERGLRKCRCTANISAMCLNLSTYLRKVVKFLVHAFFYKKNILYKNVQDQIGQKVKNIVIFNFYLQS